MSRSILLVVALLSFLVAVACGTGGSVGTAVTPETAKGAVERTVGTTLEMRLVPPDARQRGVVAWYSNSAEVPGGQVVQMFVLDSADKVDSTRRQLAGLAGDTGGLKVFTGKNVICIYGIRPGAGKDNSAAVEAAMKGL
jgi:hypothetical protein